MTTNFLFGLGTAISIGLTLGMSSTASAQISEVRVGVTEFDERTFSLPYSRKRANENSIAINGEVIFGEPKFLKWALTPQPYLNATINVEGKTSFGGAGLLWRQSLGDKFYGDFALGLTAHNGTTNIELSGEPTEANLNAFFDRFDDEIEFGSSVLSRQQLTLGYRITEDWAAEGFIEHMSHGWVFDEDINDAVNNIGVKVSRRF